MPRQPPGRLLPTDTHMCFDRLGCCVYASAPRARHEQSTIKRPKKQQNSTCFGLHSSLERTHHLGFGGTSCWWRSPIRGGSSHQRTPGRTCSQGSRLPQRWCRGGCSQKEQQGAQWCESRGHLLSILHCWHGFAVAERCKPAWCLLLPLFPAFFAFTRGWPSKHAAGNAAVRPALTRRRRMWSPFVPQRHCRQWPQSR